MTLDGSAAVRGYPRVCARAGSRLNVGHVPRDAVAYHIEATVQRTAPLLLGEDGDEDALSLKRRRPSHRQRQRQQQDRRTHAPSP